MTEIAAAGPDATDAGTTGTVVVQPWHRAHPPGSVGGSIYAVDHPHRVSAARALTDEGCRVHADVILDEAGRHQGVTWAELAEIRRSVPDAVLDLHLIHLGRPRPEQLLAHLDRALQAVGSLAVSAVTLAPAQISEHRDRLDRLRRSGHQLWAEVHPSTRAADLDGLDVDGVLVMFIQPGTKDAADLGQLAKVAELGRRLPVGVDGGITRTIAPRCLAGGASYVVSGRDLLDVQHDHHPPDGAPAPQKGSPS